jgi:hypothetical protein
VLNVPVYTDAYTGTVTSVATNTATGITGGTITTSGTLAIDTLLISTRAWRQKGVDSLQANINGKVNISDTASMLSPYLRSNVASATYVPQTRTITINGTSQDLSSNRTYNVGTVTSVATSTGTGITGGTITSTGTLAIDTALISTRAWRQKGIDSVQANLTAGLATKLNISDTASMLNPYLRKVDTASLSNRINQKLNISDTATMLGNYINNVGYGLARSGQVARADSATLSNYYLRRKDSLTSTNLLGYVTRTVLADTAAAIRGADAGELLRVWLLITAQVSREEQLQPQEPLQ